MFDAFFWLVLPVAILEGARIARFEYKGGERSLSEALMFAVLEVLLIAGCAATTSPLVFIVLAGVRVGVARAREGHLWGPSLLKNGIVAMAMVLLVSIGQVTSFADIDSVAMSETVRRSILLLICAACVVAILPVPSADEPRESLIAPIAFIMFARVALPLGLEEPWFALGVPIVAAALSLICALWLLSAGARANHFEPSALVSELLLCERGVVLSFVWLGLASGEHLAGIGALLEWWSGALALLALEASLRRRPLPKPMAFFALAMTVSLPGTVGFVAEDLLAHGLLDLRPWLAAAFVGVSAINAAALYLALTHIIADLGETDRAQARPSFMMLWAAGLSVVIGLMPQPFVASATAAHEVIARYSVVELDQHPVAVADRQ
jgi:hypothetical protein